MVCGDTPLLTLLHPASRRSPSTTAARPRPRCSTAHVADPSGYGRIVRGDDGDVLAIVEHRDADDATLALDEVNSGIYVFDAASLRSALRPALHATTARGRSTSPTWSASWSRTGPGSKASRSTTHVRSWGSTTACSWPKHGAVMRHRINEGWMRAGVSIIDPATTVIGVDVRLEADAVVHPWTLLEGATTVAAGAEVGPGSQIRDSAVGPNATVRFTTADSAVIGPGASVGPYTYLRPGTELGRGARAGAFVETKNAKVGEGSKIPHLSYVGDAEIGVGSNIGAATVFVNYDGVAKHRTVIGDHVRIGSDTMLVAPVTVGDGAYTAAGSVITDDVPPGAMGVGRARQRTIRDWVLRKRGGSESARAARAAQQTAFEHSPPMTRRR